MKPRCSRCNDKGRYEAADPENGPPGEIFYCDCPAGEAAVENDRPQDEACFLRSSEDDS